MSKKKAMTQRQAVAYGRPCYEAEDTLLPRYGWVGSRDGRWLSFRLTANVGLE